MKNSCILKMAEMICLALLILTERASGQLHEYVVIDMGALGTGNSSGATSINNKGHVTGYFYANNSLDFSVFLYKNGEMQDIGTLGGSSSWPSGINKHGQVVGYSGISNGFVHAFLYSGASMQDLGALGGDASGAGGINDNGQVVGWISPGGAFLYSGGSMQRIYTGADNTYPTGINEIGEIVGANYFFSANHAFVRYTNGSVTYLETLGGSSIATGINNSSRVIGSANIGSRFAYAFIYYNGSMQDLGTLGGNSSSASGINENGAVVGSSSIDQGNSVTHAFLYESGAMHDLNDLIINPTGWTLLEASDINDLGQIVGVGITPSREPCVSAGPSAGGLETCNRNTASSANL